MSSSFLARLGGRRFFSGQAASWWVALVVVSLGSRPAAAQEDVCDAPAQAQPLQGSGQYRAAREALLGCMDASCTAAQRTRCATALHDLEPVIPSIVVRAHDGQGNDLQDVSVSLGGEVLAPALDGMAIPIDPGEHELELRRASSGEVRRVAVRLAPSQKFRSVVVGFEPEQTEAEREAPAPLAAGRDHRGVAGAVLAGVGAGALAGFVVLGMHARSEEEELELCEPNCTSGRVDSVRARYVVANATLAVGVVSLGLATWAFLTRGSSAEPKDEAAGLSLSVAPLPRQPSVVLSGRF